MLSARPKGSMLEARRGETERAGERFLGGTASPLSSVSTSSGERCKLPKRVRAAFQHKNKRQCLLCYNTVTRLYSSRICWHQTPNNNCRFPFSKFFFLATHGSAVRPVFPSLLKAKWNRLIIPNQQGIAYRHIIILARLALFLKFLKK